MFSDSPFFSSDLSWVASVGVPAVGVSFWLCSSVVSPSVSFSDSSSVSSSSASSFSLFFSHSTSSLSLSSSVISCSSSASWASGAWSTGSASLAGCAPCPGRPEPSRARSPRRAAAARPAAIYNVQHAFFPSRRRRMHQLKSEMDSTTWNYVMTNSIPFNCIAHTKIYGHKDKWSVHLFA